MASQLVRSSVSLSNISECSSVTNKQAPRLVATQLSGKNAVRRAASMSTLRASRSAVTTQAVANRVDQVKKQKEEAKFRPVSDAAADSAKALQQLQSLSPQKPQSEKKSSIVSIGVSVDTCPVEMREKLSVPQDEWPQAIKELCAYPHIEEAAVLSTCNRFEVYVVAVSWHRGVREVEDWLSQSSGVDLEELREHLFLLRDGDATSHVLRVSAGLDSLVLGEGQILSQVKSVFEVGQNADGFGRHLGGLFKAAITAGKRVRSETKIASGAVSVSSAAAELCQMKLPTGDYNDARILIVGAGKMSRLLVKHLASKGCKKMRILNRSLPRAEELKNDFPDCDIEIGLMDELIEATENSDVVFVASSSDEPVLAKKDLETLAPASDKVGGMRRLFDISVPRNVDADVNELEGSHRVFNVDDLREVVEANKGARARAADEARTLLTEEQANFEAWRDSLETVPTIKRLRGKAEDIRSMELEKALKKMGDLDKKQRKAVEDLSRGIVNKLLHGPMQSMRSDGTDARQVSQTLVNMHALERMFDLSPQDTAAHIWAADDLSKKKGRK